MPNTDADAEAPAASITIDASADRLGGLRAFTRERMAAAGIDAAVAEDLVQAIDELACNAIQHGYRGRPGRIELALEIGNGVIRARLRDDAPAFDPRNVPEPRLDLPLEQRPLGGMGIHLARTLTDGMDHRILPGGGNEVVLTKRLGPTATPEGDDGHHDRASEP